MTQLLRRLRIFDTVERRLLLEALICLVVGWFGVRVLPFATVRRLFDRHVERRNPSCDRTRPAVDRIGWAVTTVARRAPVSITCLVQALAADLMLRTRGYESQLRLGVRRVRSGVAEALQAHAWIESDNRIIVGNLEDIADYAILAGPGGV